MANADDHGSALRNSDTLRVLLFEDNPDDAELCRRVLSKHHSRVHLDVVATLDEFNDRLQTTSYELILSDYALGKWTAVDVQAFLRNQNRDIPMILVTGALGEEKAVECIKNGMADFILKDRLERLPVAISRVLEEKKLQDENRRTDSSLRESEAKFRALADAIPAAIFIEEQGNFHYVNRAAEEITGYSREELMVLNFLQLIHRESRVEFIEHQAKHIDSGKSSYRIEIMIQPKGSERRWLDVTVGTFTHDGAPATLTTAFDITERKRADREIQYDSKTGLPNRTHLAAVFDTEASRTRRTGRTFSLIVFSFDGMKQIVKKRGQLAAGQALNWAARTTRLHCRSLDTVARIGTHQFALLLPETDIEGAEVLGCRTAARLTSGGQESLLSCRFAVVGYPKDGEVLEDVLQAADRQINITSQR